MLVTKTNLFIASFILPVHIFHARVQSSAQAFTETLLSAVVFFPQRLSFLLLAKSVNLDLQIAGKCISDTLFDFKA